MTDTATIRELCTEPSVSERLGRQFNVPLEEMLASVEGFDAYPDKLAYLDGLNQSDSSAARHASYLLAELDPETVMGHFGDKVLAWAAVNAPFSDTSEKLRDALDELAGYDGVLFEKARLWCWQRYRYSNKGSEVLAQYNIMTALHGGALKELDLPSLLQDSTRPDVTLSDKRVGDYSLMPLRARESFSVPEGWEENWAGDIGQLRYNIWLDAPTGFALAYRGIPQALAAVAATPEHEDELMIYQLQGVRPHVVNPEKKYGPDSIIGRRSARGLAPLDWQAFLVNTAEAIAVNLGMNSVAIQEGLQNDWIKPHNGKPPHMTYHAAMQAYDRPAHRLGFQRGHDGNWHRPIEVAQAAAQAA